MRVGAALPDGPHLGAGAGRAGAAGHHARHAGAGGRRHPEPALDTRVRGRAAGGTQTADRGDILTLAFHYSRCGETACGTGTTRT